MNRYEDYTPQEVSKLTAFLEQFVQYEINPEHNAELHKVLAIVRAVNKIGKGTHFLSELSNMAGKL